MGQVGTCKKRYYVCEYCKYACDSKSYINKHIHSKRHIILAGDDITYGVTPYVSHIHREIKEANYQGYEEITKRLDDARVLIIEKYGDIE